MFALVGTLSSMEVGSNAALSRVKHSFGGCNRLLQDYQTVGRELLAYERSNRLYGYRSFTSFSVFREGVVFVPVEVLESYLEDVLDLAVTDELLFIQQEKHAIRSVPLLCLLGFAGSLIIGLYAASQGAPETLCMALTLCTAVPFAVFWHMAPKGRLTRRMLFARVLSQEISRRRGRDKDGRGSNFVLASFLGKKNARSMPGAAREMIQ